MAKTFDVYVPTASDIGIQADGVITRKYNQKRPESENSHVMKHHHGIIRFRSFFAFMRLPTNKSNRRVSCFVTYFMDPCHSCSDFMLASPWDFT